LLVGASLVGRGFRALSGQGGSMIAIDLINDRLI
jgi:hypothetical protein